MARCINALDLACYCQTTASGCTVCLKNVPSPVFIEELLTRRPIFGAGHPEGTWQEQISHHTYELLPHYLGEWKSDFSRIFNSNFDKTANLKIKNIFAVFVLWKQRQMSLISIHRLYNCKCSECIRRSMKSCVRHCWIGSMHCRNAVHLWNRCCCNSGRIGSLWPLTVMQAGKVPTFADL